MAEGRISYRVETYRNGAWQSEGVFDDHALARAQAGQFADNQGKSGVRVLAESASGAYRELVYDPAQGIDGPPQRGGGESASAGGKDGSAAAPAQEANLTRSQVITAIAVLSVGALALAFVLILIFDPLG